MADTYKITASVLTYGGNVEPTYAEVQEGRDIILSIRPKDGFDIVSVTNNGAIVDESQYPNGNYKFLPDRDCAIEIMFRKTDDQLIYYGIEVINSENGGVKLYDDGSCFDDNIAVTMAGKAPIFIISPDYGYEVSDVLVDGSSVWFEGIDQYQFPPVKENHTITATFKPAQPQPTVTVTITTSSNPENGGEARGGGKYNVGDNVTMSADPRWGYKFDCWTDKKGYVISKERTFEFKADCDRTLIANFAADMTPTQEAVIIAAYSWAGTMERQFEIFMGLLKENKIRSLHEPVAVMERAFRIFGDTLRENGCD